MILWAIRQLIKWYGPETIVEFVRSTVNTGHTQLDQRQDGQQAVLARVGQELLRLDAAKRELPPRS